MNFLGENILDFDASSGDGGDGGSRGRVLPVGQVVRGEDVEEGGERPLMVLSEDFRDVTLVSNVQYHGDTSVLIWKLQIIGAPGKKCSLFSRVEGSENYSYHQPMRAHHLLHSLYRKV